MSAKAQAAYHGRDIVDRLRSTAPYTEDGPTMRDAADEIERLRAALITEPSAELVEFIRGEITHNMYAPIGRNISRAAMGESPPFEDLGPHSRKAALAVIKGLQARWLR